MPTMTIFSQGAGGPDLYFCADHGEAEQVYALLSQATDAPFRLLAFQVEDWNRDLSPWPAPPVFRDQAFAGEADKTLKWLKDNMDLSVDRRCIGGYSLAGLFSLWAFYETGLFQGAASCSGSLWFPGWIDYAQAKSAPQWGGELRKHFSKERCSQTAMPFFAVFPLYFGLFLSPVQNQMHR